jgi:cytochrome c551/c552
LPRVLFALATSHKIGLALAATLFVVFALVSALWLPRLRPDFPGAKLKGFLAVCVVITLVMLGAVIALAKEPKEKQAAAATATAPSAAGTTPAPSGSVAQGDPAAGKAYFVGPGGCGSCHRFKPAGTIGTVGPDLDHLAADAAKANRGSLAAYVHESIADPNAYVVPGFPKGVMVVPSSITPKQIDDLVAFLTQK